MSTPPPADERDEDAPVIDRLTRDDATAPILQRWLPGDEVARLRDRWGRSPTHQGVVNGEVLPPPVTFDNRVTPDAAGAGPWVVYDGHGDVLTAGGPAVEPTRVPGWLDRQPPHPAGCPDPLADVPEVPDWLRAVAAGASPGKAGTAGHG